MSNLVILVPCYNEEVVLLETARQLGNVLERLKYLNLVNSESSIYFVDDGSNDETWQLIELVARKSQYFHGIKLSRHRGHQNALLAGLLTVPGEAVISIDADLQDDLGAIEAMIRQYNAGADVVYGVRSARKIDSQFKQWTATIYYQLLALLGVELVPHHADFRLLSRRAVDALKQYPEVNLYIRGIVPQLGYTTALVYYERKARFAGVSKYSVGKMLRLAFDGITSFSTVPLRIITFAGAAISSLSFIVTAWAVAIRLFTTYAVPGWTSTVVPMYFLGGIQLFSLGVIGEYIGKIYNEVKRRPRFLIDKTI